MQAGAFRRLSSKRFRLYMHHGVQNHVNSTYWSLSVDAQRLSNR